MQKLIVESKPLLASLRVSDNERKDIQKIFDQSEAVCKDLAKYTSKHKQSINRHVMNIEQAKTPSELDLPSFLQTLKAAEADFDVGRESVTQIQTRVQAIIEPCRNRIKECKKEMDEMSQEFGKTQQELDSAFLESFELVFKGVTNELGRQESERIADAYEERRNSRAVFGTLGTVGAFGLGFALAPFTAGGSIAMGLAVAAPSALVSGAGVMSDHQQKEQWKKNEQIHRSRVYECEKRVEELQKKTERCVANIAKLAKELDDLEKAVTILESFNSSLYQADKATVFVHDILEEFILALSAAHLESETFESIKATFASNPNKLGPMAEARMLDLKDKWHQLQKVMEVNAHQFICD